ncbi:GNAT family N-acetyltransferase [Streptomyces sp. 549]|uniref:GNAT family N-acetyltransferase n=1 Tax=Streptomyces sp. 549 TaxID=3049076 RepID=UPI0024C23839|nr:GNAT family N-acetyltransferase [Streptomyces sp. 549]MDK1476767.1 GNAT family N-acetyltransferase [Streptomyces sp. 549]
MQGEPLIRTAAATDGEALADLDGRTWSPLHAVTPRPRRPYGPFFDGHHLPRNHLVAVVGGRTAGYLRLVAPTPLPSNRHVRQIQGLAVDDWARGRGVARALLRAAADTCRLQDVTRLTLRVLATNTPARRLYATEGFTVEGVLPGEFVVEGRTVDDVLMGRVLPPGGR